MSSSVKRILVIKPSSLGDILHVFPAVLLLHRRFPDAEIDWLVGSAFKDVLLYCPFPVAHAILFRRRRLGKLSTFFCELLHLIRELRSNRYDLVIDFQGLLRSAFLGFCARGARPVGFANPREAGARFFYGRCFNVVSTRHAVERNVELVNALLGGDEPVPPVRCPCDRSTFDLPAETSGMRLIGVVPGARWPSKRFTPELFTAVMRAIRQKIFNACFLLIGSAEDRNAVGRIMALFGESGALSLAGRTGIGEMMEVIARCELVIGNDSGPIHAAASLGVPVISFFGPTRPELTGPYGCQNQVFRLDLECSGCMKRKCSASERYACHRLDAEAVAASAVRYLMTGGWESV